jgi:eukaryotic-like serine/threonine-protein kinase
MERVEISGTVAAPPQLAQSRYELIARIAAGGMATVYVGRLRGAAGFWRLCAVKRAHTHLVEDGVTRALLVSEARLASRLSHPNVVSVFDVEELDGELLLVMEYVEGAALSDLVRSAQARDAVLPPGVGLRIGLDACAGLHAAHELTGDAGERLGLVHRDVSPQNILIGLDGIARITDFGIAKVHTGDGEVRTTTGALKGKVGYMAPEYIRGQAIDRRSDEFALAVVLWEALAGQRLFRGEGELDTMTRVLSAPVPALSRHVEGADTEIDDVFKKALARSPNGRFPDMMAFSRALELAAGPSGLLGTHADVARFVKEHVGAEVAARRELVRARIGELDGEQSATRPRPPAVTVPIDLATETFDAETFATDAAEIDEHETIPAETVTNALAQPAPRRPASRALLIAIGGAVLGVLGTLALVQMRSADVPAPAVPPPPPAQAARSLEPESTRAPAAAPTIEPSASAEPAPPASAPRPARSWPRPPHKAPGDKPDPNPYGH